MGHRIWATVIGVNGVPVSYDSIIYSGVRCSDNAEISIDIAAKPYSLTL